MKKLYIIFTALFVTVSAVLLWWSYSDTYFAGDEILFCYRIDQGVQGLIFGNDVKRSDIDMIATPCDVVVSQATHWRHGHGRNLITAVEQLFSGAFPTWLFYIVNALVWVYCIYLTVRIGTVGKLRTSMWVWLITVSSYFFLFPGEGDLFTSINLSTNYLWPIAMTLTAYVIWNHYRGVAAGRFRAKSVALIAAGVILGWSHEAWCLPMSCTLAVWYRWLARDERKSLAGWFAIGYGIGSLILLASPGNFNRTYIEVVGPMTESVWPRVLGMFASITYCNIFWWLVIALILWGIRRPRKIWDFILATKFWWVLGVFSMAFVMVFHTTERSFVAVDMVSLILILKFIDYAVAPHRVNRCPFLAALLMLGVVTLMWYVAQLQRSITKAEKDAIATYVESPQGLAIVDYPYIPDWAGQWVRCKLPTSFTKLTISWEKFDGDKAMTVLSPEEYDMLSKSPERMFTPANRIGQSPFYTIDDGLSAWTTDSTTKFQFWKWRLKPASVSDPVNPLRKLGRVVAPFVFKMESDGRFIQQVEIGDSVYYRTDKYAGRGLSDAYLWR